MNSFDRILGSLYGTAMGDAMGMPTENWSRKRIVKHYGEISCFMPGSAENNISSGFAAGEVTDDTLMTVLVAEMLMETEGLVNPHLFMKKLEGWIERNPKSNTVVGPSTRQAIFELSKGTPIEETGKNGVTNGAAMKISPIGLINSSRNMEALVDQVHRICLPTHHTGVAISGATAVASCISYAVSGGENLNEMLTIAIDSAKKGSEVGYDVPSASIASRISLCKKMIDESGEQDSLDFIYSVIGTGLPTVETVPAALAIVYLANGDPLKSAYYSANIGGDTDTIGAIAGGICGALKGADAINEDVKKQLKQVNKIDFESIAKGLHSIRERAASNAI